MPNNWIDDVACILYFLAGAVKENKIYNTRKANEAFDAFLRITPSLDPAKVKAEFIMRGYLT